MSALSVFMSIRGGLIKGQEAWIAGTGVFLISIIIVLVDFYKTRKRPSNL
jgi:hypothetical protein